MSVTYVGSKSIGAVCLSIALAIPALTPALSDLVTRIGSLQSQIAANAATGIQVDASGYTDTSSIVNNTVYACNKGIDTSAVTGTGDTRVDVNFNSVSECAVYNYVLTGSAYATRYMSFNHSYHTTSSKHTDLGSHLFANITGQFNVPGDPLYTGASTGNFSPAIGSPLLLSATTFVGASPRTATSTTGTRIIKRQ